MGEHTEFPWCIPAGAQNGFIICGGDDPKKPGAILMIVSAPRGRSRVLTDADINDNTAFMVKAAQCHEALVKALEAMCGYLLNAKIDLETGCTKATAIKTIEGGIKQARQALAKVRT